MGSFINQLKNNFKVGKKEEKGSFAITAVVLLLFASLAPFLTEQLEGPSTVKITGMQPVNPNPNPSLPKVDSFTKYSYERWVKYLVKPLHRLKDAIFGKHKGNQFDACWKLRRIQHWIADVIYQLNVDGVPIPDFLRDLQRDYNEPGLKDDCWNNEQYRRYVQTGGEPDPLDWPYEDLYMKKFNPSGSYNRAPGIGKGFSFELPFIPIPCGLGAQVATFASGVTSAVLNSIKGALANPSTQLAVASVIVTDTAGLTQPMSTTDANALKNMIDSGTLPNPDESLLADTCKSGESGGALTQGDAGTGKNSCNAALLKQVDIDFTFDSMGPHLGWDVYLNVPDAMGTGALESIDWPNTEISYSDHHIKKLSGNDMLIEGGVLIKASEDCFATYPVTFNFACGSASSFFEVDCDGNGIYVPEGNEGGVTFSGGGSTIAGDGAGSGSGAAGTGAGSLCSLSSDGLSCVDGGCSDSGGLCTLTEGSCACIGSTGEPIGPPSGTPPSGPITGNVVKNTFKTTNVGSSTTSMIVGGTPQPSMQSVLGNQQQISVGIPTIPFNKGDLVESSVVYTIQNGKLLSLGTEIYEYGDIVTTTTEFTPFGRPLKSTVTDTEYLVDYTAKWIYENNDPSQPQNKLLRMEDNFGAFVDYLDHTTIQGDPDLFGSSSQFSVPTLSKTSMLSRVDSVNDVFYMAYDYTPITLLTTGEEYIKINSYFDLTQQGVLNKQSQGIIFGTEYIEIPKLTAYIPQEGASSTIKNTYGKKSKLIEKEKWSFRGWFEKETFEYNNPLGQTSKYVYSFDLENDGVFEEVRDVDYTYTSNGFLRSTTINDDYTYTLTYNPEPVQDHSLIADIVTDDGISVMGAMEFVTPSGPEFPENIYQ